MMYIISMFYLGIYVHIRAFISFICSVFGSVGHLMWVLWVWVGVLPLCAQTYFSHHASAPYLYNAAYLGRLNGPEVALLTRARWVGYQSTYDTRGNLSNAQHLSLLYPFAVAPVGIGVGITRAAAGPLQQLNIQTMVNYTLRVSARAQLGFSLTPSWLIHQRDISLYRAIDPVDPVLGTDRALHQFTLQAGTVFFYDALMVGLSVHDLFALSFSDAPNAQISVPLSVNLMSSYDFALGRRSGRRRGGLGIGRGGAQTISTTAVDKRIIISPSLFAVYRPGAFTFNVGTQVAYDRIWAGMLYRYEEALTFFGGVRVLKGRNLRIGYSLETVLHHTRSKAATSHELYLAFGFQSLRKTSRSPIYTPRFYY